MDYVILILAGALAGFINTVAGAGSLLTIPALIFAGLDANAANATNRIPVLVQNAVALGMYRRHRVEGAELGLRLCVPAVLASVLGAAVATQLSRLAMQIVIALCMIAFVPLSLRMNRRIAERSAEAGPPPMSRGTSRPSWIVFAAIGFFGGFVQAGVGILILLVLAIANRMNLVVANHVKALVVFVLTVGALLTFIVLRAQIDLTRGIVLSAATVVGAVLGARENLRRGERFISLVTSVVALGAAARLLWAALAEAQG